jgi:hypothetical protein
MFILEKPWNFFHPRAYSGISGKIFRILNSGLYMFIGCTHMFRPLRNHHLHIIVCKTRMFKFSIALKTRLCRCEYPMTLESDWTGSNSIRLCWCVRTLTCIAHGVTWRNWLGFTTPQDSTQRNDASDVIMRALISNPYSYVILCNLLVHLNLEIKNNN